MPSCTWPETGSTICWKLHLLEALPKKRVLACKEDLEARGVQAGERVIVPENFYELLVEDMISEGSRIYSF